MNFLKLKQNVCFFGENIPLKTIIIIGIIFPASKRFQAGLSSIKDVKNRIVSHQKLFLSILVILLGILEQDLIWDQYLLLITLV
jgi:hypothetical protein